MWLKVLVVQTSLVVIIRHNNLFRWLIIPFPNTLINCHLHQWEFIKTVILNLLWNCCQKASDSQTAPS